MIDLVGQMFGKLTVLSQHSRNKHGHLLCWCRCECGNEKSIPRQDLRSGNTQSCGECPNKVDHAGGGVTVIWLERNKGKELIPCLIDTADYPAIKMKRWYVRRSDAVFYAEATDGDSSVFMHRFLFPHLEQSTEVDHRNGNGLDNRRRNLRSATKSQNQQNIRGRQNATGFKGVSIRRNKFRAEIKADGKRILLGTFSTLQDAARAYNVAAIEHFGEFAYTNDLLDVSDVVLNGSFINGPLKGQSAT